MSKSLNNMQAIGNLSADPEMRFTEQGSAVTTFTLALNREWTTKSGQRDTEVEWLSVVAWSKLAEICNQYLKKGSKVYVSGRLKTRSWDDKQTGEKRYKTEVIINDMIILSGSNAGSKYEMPEDDDTPF